MTITSLRDTPISVIDFETTGLSARSGARVVELAVTRIEPGKVPNVVLDTLIDPEGPVLCSSIHGIEDEDVLGAPRFTDILGDLVLALDGSVVAAFNVSFDMSFLLAEARMARATAPLREPPHICLMWMRPLLGLSKRCSLEDACRQHGLRAGTHRAAEDALACAHMWEHYVHAAEQIGLNTWSDLSRHGTHKYLSSLTRPPYSQEDFSAVGGRTSGTARKPRPEPIRSPIPATAWALQDETSSLHAERQYWHALVDASSDGLIDRSEVHQLRRLQQLLGLSSAAMRDAHARLFADLLTMCAEDGVITDDESDRIRGARASLAELGWAPG